MKMKAEKKKGIDARARIEVPVILTNEEGKKRERSASPLYKLQKKKEMMMDEREMREVIYLCCVRYIIRF